MVEMFVVARLQGSSADPKDNDEHELGNQSLTKNKQSEPLTSILSVQEGQWTAGFHLVTEKHTVVIYLGSMQK